MAHHVSNIKSHMRFPVRNILKMRIRYFDIFGDAEEVQIEEPYTIVHSSILSCKLRSIVNREWAFTFFIFKQIVLKNLGTFPELTPFAFVNTFDEGY